MGPVAAIAGAIGSLGGFFDDIIFGPSKIKAQAAHDQSQLALEKAHDQTALKLAALQGGMTQQLVRGAELIAIIGTGGLLGWALLRG